MQNISKSSPMHLVGVEEKEAKKMKEQKSNK